MELKNLIGFNLRPYHLSSFEATLWGMRACGIIFVDQWNRVFLLQNERSTNWLSDETVDELRQIPPYYKEAWLIQTASDDSCSTLYGDGSRISNILILSSTEQYPIYN